MSMCKSLIVFMVFATATIVACSRDASDDNRSFDGVTTVTPPTDLLGRQWTLETVRGADGDYRPLPLLRRSTWSLVFDSSGRVSGNALCNEGSGTWQANDATLSISTWTETEIDCGPDVQLISSATQGIVARWFQGETMMFRRDAKRLFIDTGDGAQLVFSGRFIREDEQNVTVDTLIRTDGGARASHGDPVFGRLSPPYIIVYRDAESLDADYAQLPQEGIPWPALPRIDFSTSLVVGAYLPLEGSISSDVVVRGAYLSSNTLDIEVARFDSHVTEDGVSADCGADTALSAPWTLVRVDSRVEAIEVSEMVRGYCSGVPVSD